VSILSIFKQDKILLSLIVGTFLVLGFVSIQNHFLIAQVSPSIEVSKQAILDNSRLILENKRVIEENTVLTTSSIKREEMNHVLLIQIIGDFRVMQDRQDKYQDTLEKRITELKTELAHVKELYKEK
jgi:adenylate kinase family enzyme